MPRLRLAVALLGGSLVAFLLAGAAPVTADDKNPSNEEIMKKLHGKTGAHKLIKKALADGSTDWDAIATHAKLYSDLSNLLEKNKPDMGDVKSWQKLSKSYAADAKALSEAVAKKDKEAVKTVFAKLSDSCDACHELHRP